MDNDQDTKPGEGEEKSPEELAAEQKSAADAAKAQAEAEAKAAEESSKADEEEAKAKAEAEAAEKAAAAAREKAEAARKKKAPKPGEGETVLEGSNCSCDGSDYMADKFGFVVVKTEHADLLCRDFGFKKV